MNRKSKFFKYFREYEWSNIFAMIRNNHRDPKICSDDFNNRTVVITGATSGIGYLAARKYASRGANLICVNRREDKSKAMQKELQDEFGIVYDYIIADLSILGDIHRAGRELANLKHNLDVIIHNAGVYLTRRETTVDGLEKVFVVHYLSSFIINYYLTDKLRSQDKSRIILVSSEGHRFEAWGLRLDDLLWEKRRYSGLKSYGSAKLAQLLSMMVFNERFCKSGLSVIAMHPGAVKTETGQDNGPVYKWFKKNFIDKTLRPPDISAEALYYLGVSDEVDKISGKFFNLTTVEEPAPPALDMEVANELWEISREMANLNS